jgi:hypothetical protein
VPFGFQPQQIPRARLHQTTGLDAELIEQLIEAKDEQAGSNGQGKIVPAGDGVRWDGADQHVSRDAPEHRRDEGQH